MVVTQNKIESNINVLIVFQMSNITNLSIGKKEIGTNPGKFWKFTIKQLIKKDIGINRKPEEYYVK